jgi:hypothetical protein
LSPGTPVACAAVEPQPIELTCRSGDPTRVSAWRLVLLGAFLLATHSPNSRYGWLAFLGAKVAMTAFAMTIGAHGLLVQQLGFTSDDAARPPALRLVVSDDVADLRNDELRLQLRTLRFLEIR